MDISERGLDLIKSFEGLHKKKSDGYVHAYLDPVGIPTIGWGCTKNVKMGMKRTEAECEKMLMKEVAQFEDAVERLVKVPLNENQFAALVSFSYNVGSGALAKSTLLRELNRGNYDTVPSQLMRWVNAGGKKFSGLARRRAAEAALWSEPTSDGGPETVEESAEEMPQKVEPAQPSSVKVAAESNTIRAAFVAMAGTLAQAWNWLFSTAKEAGTDAVASQQALTPLEALFKAIGANMPMIAAAVVLGSLVVVIMRRLSRDKA